MKARIKTDFEKWLKTQLVKEGTDYYLAVGARKLYFFFEGQKTKDVDLYTTIQIHPSDTERVATGTKYHTGIYKFFIYGVNALLPDTATDALITLLDEKIINLTGDFRIETGVMSTKYRGNKFEGARHYENITEIPFYHWSS